MDPSWGCTKVSQACKLCYAEAWARRTGGHYWGPRAPRRFFGDQHWKEPLNWNDEAAALGNHRRVFCASMADVFEYRAELTPWREKLWDLIEQTPNLDWLLLTKRPQRIALHNRWSAWPSNVWLGSTVENQRTADERHKIGCRLKKPLRPSESTHLLLPTVLSAAARECPARPQPQAPVP
jgi:protein gp37